NGTLVYRIPGDGVLGTRQKASYRVRQIDYFYVEADNDRMRIPVLLRAGLEDIGKTTSNVDMNSNDVYVFGEEMGATPTNRPHYRRFMTFIVAEARNIKVMLK